MLKKYCILILLSLCLNIIEANDQIVFDKITVRNGLSSSTISSIVQDKDGFMWFGSAEGLNRFDGTEIITFYSDPNNPNSISSDKINCLKVTPDNKLFVSTASGVDVYNRETNDFSTIKHNNQNIGFARDICATSEGVVFITTNRNIFKLEKGEAKLVFSHPNLRNTIQYKKDVLLVATNNNLLLINYFGELLNTFDLNSDKIDITDNILTVFKDSENMVWIGTLRNGLIRFDTQSGTIYPISIGFPSNLNETSLIRTIEEDNLGNIWFGSESGLYIYNKRDNDIKHYPQSLIPNTFHPNDNAIYAIYRSKEGIMWIATFFGGVNYCKPKNHGFNSLLPGYDNSIQGKAVSKIFEDSKKRLWIGTEDGGITIIDNANNSVNYLNEKTKPFGLTTNNVHAICEDDNGIYWIGTFMAGVNRYDSKTGKISVYKKQNNDTNTISNNNVDVILRDKEGKLWFGTRNGLNVFDKTSGRFLQFMPEVFGNKSIHEIIEDSKGNLWFGNSRNDDLYCLNKKSNTVKHYKYSNKKSATQLLGFLSICEDETGQIWVGTRANGLLKLDKTAEDFRTFNVENGLPNNTVYGIVENKGDLWISTNNGLSKFDIEKEQFTNYNVSHNLPHNQFNYRSYGKDSDGKIYFGTVYGLTYFQPDSLKSNKILPIAYLTKLKINNKAIVQGTDNIIREDINSVKHITLTYDQIVITLEFSAIDLISESNNQFAYMLEGFDNEWNYVGKQKNATYTNLPHGKYTFKVKTANNDGVWSTNAHELKITVKPPFYLTIVAKLLYLILIFGAVYLYNVYLIFRNKEKADIEFERLEKNKIKELNQHKINFFTNISHELKTPLTLIIANIDKLLSQDDTKSRSHESLLAIKKHASRLHNLISQLMEFRKAESSHTKLDIKRGDIIMFLHDTFNAFIPLYAQKAINYRISCNVDSFETLFDADKIEKITANILTNSIKHCDEMDRISLEIELLRETETKPSILKMKFIDSGVGIPAALLDKVFDPFVHDDKENALLSSSGIGLAFVKVLVDFLKGSILLESIEGEGTQVTITIPLNTVENHDDTIQNIYGNKSISINSDLILDTPKPETDSIDDLKWKVLIVEDNADLLAFLTNHFAEKYNVMSAKNGKHGYEKAIKYLPDLIISDVLMPQMDGIELCRNLRENNITSHIPIILLTAKSGDKSKHEALNAGADLFLTKPFDLKEVDILVANFIASREKMKKHFIADGEIKTGDVSFNNRDHSFIAKLTTIVNNHIDDPDFDVTIITKELGASRSLIHSKLKKILNLSTTEFVKTIKMKRAAELMANDSLTVAEVGYKVGYSDPNYFSRSFKEFYGVNPSAYKQKISDTNSSQT